MKRKFTRILGVALPLAMVLALAVALLPASTPTAEADVGTLKFETIPLPKFNADGDWVLAPNTELGVIAVAPGGSVIFASANTTSGSANVSSLLRSSDGGYTWTTIQDNFPLGQTTIVDIEVSPEYSSDSTIMVATEDYIWTSVDGGTVFTENQPTGWGASENIIDMDVILDEGGRLATIIGTTADSFAGDAYVQCPSTTGSSWQAQDIGATRNVLAVAFSVNFASDECIMAVTISAAATEMRLAFGSTRDGGGWGDAIGDAEFLDGLDPITNTTRARIAFPDDYDVDSLTSNIAFVGLTATDVGDVFKVVLETGTTSTAIDMNVRGLVGLQPTASDIWSIDASGDADAGAAIIVGLAAWSTATTPDTWLAYYSTDSGDNWYSARSKSPTGGDPAWSASTLLDAGTNAECNVAMAADFATSGVAYAVTKGDGTYYDALSGLGSLYSSTLNAGTSAFSRTANGGKSWNQISLIDYSDVTNTYYVNNLKANVVYSGTPEIYMVTAIVRDLWTMGMAWHGGTLWKTANGGGTWERILSYASPSVTPNIDSVATTGDATVFAKDRVNGKFWRSSDAGATFPRVVSSAARADAIAVADVVDESSMEIIDLDGQIWTTTNLGRPWTAPDESIVEGHYPNGYEKLGDIVLVPTADGRVFISTDGGVTITDTLGRSDFAPNYVIVAFDSNYDTTHFVYATVPAGGVRNGIWRIEVNEDDPGSTDWERIDGDAVNLLAGADSVVGYVGFQLGAPLYVFDFNAVDLDANTGGLWRCVNPTADVDGLYPPRFEKTQVGLETGDAMGYLGFAVYPNTVFMKNAAHANTPVEDGVYFNQVYAFGDVLSAPVSLVLPDDGATDVGVRLETIDLTMEVLAGWETVTSALSYEYQLALDEEFLSPIADQSATAQEGQQARFNNLPLGWTYYWRVRVDSPLWSPWSEGHSFTVATIEPEVVVVPFDIVSPELGATDVSIQPTFVWAEVEGATSYELVVAEDPTFAIIDWSRTSANTFYKAEEALAYDSTYAWKVRAAPDGEWATGVFTTEAVPVEPVEPTVIEPAAPAEIKIVEVPAAAPIPTYLLWTIIGVGAVLFIALIVLIVRTRRTT